jgi:hypothetical protein
MRNRISFALLLSVPFLLLSIALAPAAGAVTVSAVQGNETTLFGLLPASVAIGFIASFFIPWVSALFSRADTTWTGVVVVLLSFINGFFSDWAAHWDNFNWKAALGASLLNWAIAATSHTKIARGGPVYNAFLNFGSNTVTRTRTEPNTT